MVGLSWWNNTSTASKEVDSTNEPGDDFTRPAPVKQALPPTTADESEEEESTGSVSVKQASPSTIAEGNEEEE